MNQFNTVWKKVPLRVRQTVVLIVGSLFIIAAILTGWLPGPGGIPLFLIGIAILSTEFEKARRFRDYILQRLSWFGRWFKKHQDTAYQIAIIFACLFAIGLVGYFTS